MPSGIQTSRPATKYRLSVCMPASAARAAGHEQAEQAPDPQAWPEEADLEPSAGGSPLAAESPLVSPVDASPVFAGAPEAGLLLKSVAYQPLPFSWKPAAVSIFEKSGLPQAVQVVRGASLTFCRNSC